MDQPSLHHDQITFLTNQYGSLQQVLFSLKCFLAKFSTGHKTLIFKFLSLTDKKGRCTLLTQVITFHSFQRLSHLIFVIALIRVWYQFIHILLICSNITFVTFDFVEMYFMGFFMFFFFSMYVHSFLLKLIHSSLIKPK